MASGDWPRPGRDKRVPNENPGIACYILAGGASSRFGSDKAMTEFRGVRMLDRMIGRLEGISDRVRVVAPAAKYAHITSVEIIPDRWPGEGPLGGIITALLATQERKPALEWNFVVSCDMPFLSRKWLGYMMERSLASDAEVVVPQSAHGLEPLCACWRTAAVGKLQSAFGEGVRKVTDGMKRLRAEVLDDAHWKRFDDAGRLFWNMNTQQDYQEALRIWEAEKL